MKDPDKTQRANAKIRAEAYADALVMTPAMRREAREKGAKLLQKLGFDVTADDFLPKRTFDCLMRVGEMLWQ